MDYDELGTEKEVPDGVDPFTVRGQAEEVAHRIICSEAGPT